MATIALSAVGMAVGGSIGGTVLGLSAATIGRAAGAAIGRRIDQQILGGGSETVETGRIDRFRVTGAAEGADIQRIYGRMRVPGQVIWASQFQESSTTTGGGKGGPSTPKTTTYAYSVSLAIALCEGEISRIGRVWADGEEVSPETLNMRLYPGTLDQQPDPKIAAVEGAENTPAYRGTAYVVLEDLALAPFGNRIPQLTFEVVRGAPAALDPLTGQITGITLMPGTGEYALATTQVHLNKGYGASIPLNTNTPLGPSDFAVSMDALAGDLPAAQSVVFPVAWFGDDLRCNSCQIAPMVEQQGAEVSAMPWRVSGITRGQADVVPSVDDLPLYGGTPTDAAVVEAIADLSARGKDVVFSPLLLMTQVAGNSLPDPWTGEAGQDQTPWRGRITTALAPGWPSSTDGTATAATEVAAFLGAADSSDFSVSGTTVSHTGPADIGYRRFILHYAHLCAAAGGVSAFCIGSQLSGLTSIRDDQDGFPMVDGLIQLAADVRGILGPDCKISYAADWTEFHGMTPVGTDDKLFHLDALWADPNIDFIGIEQAMPLSDWRAGTDHADAEAGSIYDLNYLTGNVTGGEHYDWYYPTPEARAAQRRVAISDPDGEDWVRRAKDLAGWWANAHHDRVGGARSATASAWMPKSKPISFTAAGCPAVHLGANAPDTHQKVAGGLPYGSDGSRDDLMQVQYLRAILGHYSDPANNPVSDQYVGQMLDKDRVHATGWDARPFPFWPGNQVMWSDGADYPAGPALNGRASNRSLASVVAEICEAAGVAAYDVSDLHGLVRGYAVTDSGTGRAALQPLMLAYGFDAIERDGVLEFRNRRAHADQVLIHDDLARDPDSDEALRLTRAPAAEIAGRVQLAHLDADADYDAVAAELVLPDETGFSITRDELPLALTRAEGRATVARWLQEARQGRETARFGLPPSSAHIGVGDVVSLQTDTYHGSFRIDRIEEVGTRVCEAMRVAEAGAETAEVATDLPALRPYTGPNPVELIFLDLPLLTGDEIPHAPHLAAVGRPWPGSIAVYASPQDSDYALKSTVETAATVGISLTDLPAGPIGIFDRQAGVEVALVDGTLASATKEALLAGANALAIGDPDSGDWEILQFRDATLIGDRHYRLSGLLRGQFGTRTLMPAVRVAGARVVLLNGVPQQIDLPSAARGVARHFRWGPARLALSDPTFRYDVRSFDGNGLRPYPVAHLRTADAGGDLHVNWIRSTRIDGDLWGEGDVPVGEESEVYFVRATQGGITLRDGVVTDPSWTYTAAEMAFDTGGAPFRVEVAQVSERYGTGPFMGVDVG